MEREFTSLITEHSNIIYKVCYFYTTDDYTIEELFQESVINLWKAYPKFRGDCKVTTWIYRISVNTCISYLRKSFSRPATVTLSFKQDEMAATDDNRNEYLKEMYGMINQLGKLERALILLWLEERSYQEISEILGISKANVGVKLNRVKEKLKKMSNR